jgi:transcriptional regulator with XRE-family HTH domain
MEKRNGSRNGSSIRRRILGRRLRELREQAGFTLEAAAPALDASVSRLSRIETGQQKADVHLVKSMLDLFDAGGDNWTELLDLAREAGRRGWYRAYGLGDNSYVGYETEATQVLEYALGFVPGLLQVPDYTRALFDASPMRRSDMEREREVEIRAIRQQRLRSADDPLQVLAILDEAVLRNPVGGSATLQAQLVHLAAVAELPTVTLHVLPAGQGAHPALGSGFTLLSFGDLGEPDMAYVEHALGAAHLEKEPEVTLARLKFDQLRARALARAESTELIKRIALEDQPGYGDAVNLDHLAWRTSSFSGENGNSCVEVALLPDGGVAVRDTKDRTRPPHVYPAAEWVAFVQGVKAGEFDQPR